MTADLGGGRASKSPLALRLPLQTHEATCATSGTSCTIVFPILVSAYDIRLTGQSSSSPFRAACSTSGARCMVHFPVPSYQHTTSNSQKSFAEDIPRLPFGRVVLGARTVSAFSCAKSDDSTWLFACSPVLLTAC